MSDRKSLLDYWKDDNSVLWIENYVANVKIRTDYKVETLLHYEQSPYQQISIVDTKVFGRILVLDGIPQISTLDGSFYNEMISHIPIVTHPDPKKVVMIGGGDCGPAREAMKYTGIDQISVVEIDERVTEVCRKWLTPAAFYKKDPRLQMIHRDGMEWIQKNKGNCDVLIIDRSDPIGPSTKLYKSKFYKHVFECLTDDGVVAFQSGSPIYNTSTLRRTFQNLKELFPIVRTYLVTIPLYPCGIWSFTVASKKYDPLHADLGKLQHQNTKYITPEVFLASFALPKYVKDLLAEKIDE